MNPETTDRLRDVLAAVGLPVSARELTEILWLACQLPAAPAEAGGPPADAPGPGAQLPEPGPAKSPDDAAPPPGRPDDATPVAEQAGQAAPHGLYAPAATDGRGLTARTAWVPTAPMLHDMLAIQRALRPLKRRVASRRADVLDEDATARRIAEQPAGRRRWVPALRPATERWLSLALVVDTGPSMWIWRPLARELQETLIRLGAFRDVRLWYLSGGRVASTPGGPPLPAAALLDPSGRQVCLVLSDCSGAHWWAGPAIRALRLWGQHGPVGIVQPLAERLWRRTATPPVPGLMQAQRAMAPNTELRFTPYDASPGPGLPVPVMEIAPRWLADWARLIASPATPPLPMAVAYLPGRPVSRAQPLRREQDLPITERVQRFRAAASPEAARLAAHAAVSVPTLPVLRLIHHQLLRSPQPGHIAEVLLSGLLRPVAGEPGSYEFIPGARQALLATQARSVSWYTADVLARISSEIENRIGRAGESFQAYLPAPAGTGALTTLSRQPFALVSPEALGYLRRDSAVLPSAPGTGLAEELRRLRQRALSGPLPTPTEESGPEPAPAPADGPLIRILGPMEVWTGQDWAAVGTPASRQVLAILLLNRGRPMTAAELAAEIWPTDPPDRYRNLVSNYVSQLRRLLGTGRRAAQLTWSAGRYQLVLEPGDLDVDRFTQAQAVASQAVAAHLGNVALDLCTEALGWWRGSALVDVSPSPLVSAEAERLAQARFETVRLWAEASRDCGQYETVVSALRPLVEAQPVPEGLWVELIQALVALDRPSEALDAYHRARSAIAGRLGAGPGPELQGLYQEITGAAAGPDPDDGDDIPQETRPVPAQLPPGIADFTGRADQLEGVHGLLAAEVRDSAPGTVVVVLGMAGVGKTALAVHAAHLAVDHYPDGQLFASLRGSSDQPVSPADVLASFLQGLGVPAELIPGNVDDRAALYRDQLAGRRVLIVLDDAKDAAQLRPLLPGNSSCAVLVTSRHRLADLEPSIALHLDVLTPDQAGALLAGLVGEARLSAEPEATQAVLAACAGLPLAIRIVGGQLAAHPRWTIRDLAAELADERRRLDLLEPVRPALATSYDNLPRWPADQKPDPARLFRLLGLWTGPSISLPAISALLGQPGQQVTAALIYLDDVHLVLTADRGRARLHDLVRLFAAERVRADELHQEQTAAVTRLLTWYLHSAAAAARMISPHEPAVPLGPLPETIQPLEFGTAAEAIAWYETERAGLVAAVGLADSYALHELAWKLPAAAMSLFARRRHWTECEITHTVGLASSQVLGDRAAEAWMLTNRGVAFAAQRRDVGIDLLQEAMSRYAEIRDGAGQARAANGLAAAYLELDRYEAALRAGQDALGWQQNIGSPYGEAIATGVIANSLQRMGRSDEAGLLLQQARAIFAELGDEAAVAAAGGDLGATYLSLGQASEAIPLFEDALAGARATGDRYGEAIGLLRLARAERARGDTQSALQLASEANGIFEELEERDRYIETRTMITELVAEPPRAADRDQPGEAEPTPLSDVRFLTVAETAIIMRVSKTHVYRLIHSGELEAIRVGRAFRIPEQAVNQYLRKAFVGE